MLKKFDLRIPVMVCVLICAIAFSSVTLWLLDSWIKYPLFILEIFTIIILYLVCSKHNFQTEIRRLRIEELPESLFDVLLIISATILLLFNILNFQGEFLQLILTLAVTSFLPGYSLIKLVGLKDYFSRLARIIFSFILSYIFTGFLALMVNFISKDARASIFLSSYIVLGLISTLKHKKQKKVLTQNSFTRNIDALGIILLLVFFASSYTLIYPNFALLPGTDISRHYWSSVVLSRTPNIYIGSTYLLAHLHESSFISIANLSFVATQIGLVSLNLLLPIAFYIMAKIYTERIDTRLPILATLFWVLFTNGFGGFSWLYFTYLKLSSIEQSQIQLLNAAADKTYNGTLYGILGLWYVPAIISFVILMAAIFLLKKKEIPELKYAGLFSILVAALFLVHVVEGAIFITFLAVYGLISKNADIRFDTSLKASIIGIAITFLVFWVFSQLTARLAFDLILTASIVGPMLLVFTSLIARGCRQKHALVKRPRLKISFVQKTLISLLMFAYVVALLAWTSFIDSFHTLQVNSTGIVPWFMYPFMLGITGLLSVCTLYKMAESTNKNTKYNPLKLFIAFMIFAFVAGTIVSTLNLNFFDVNYWEKRFIWFIKISLAILSPIPILLLFDKLIKRTQANPKAVVSCLLIGTIVLYGISTTFLNIEYWNIRVTNPANILSSTELNAINAFSEILDKDPYTWVTAISDRSAAAVVFAAPADMLVLRQLLYTANTPEMALTQLYRHPAYDHPYIYLNSRDAPYLSTYPDSFLSTYIHYLPEVFGNSEVAIYNVSSLSFPQLTSKTVLLVPFDLSIEKQNLPMAYYLLSQGYYNYTVAYDLDPTALNSNTVVLPFDPPEGNTRTNIFHDTFNQTLALWSAIKGNWRIEDAQLVGGVSGIMGEGVCLSTVAAENFTATARVIPLSGDTTAANYASIIYSWVDSKNYRVADIYFNADGYIYLLFRDFANGVETASPRWPGEKTTLKWAFNDNFVVKLTVNGASTEISLNDTSYLSSNFENARGKIGLRYYRFYKVAFDNFFVNYTTPINLRPINDYLDYLNAGGRIVLLNTGENGFFSKDLFTISNSVAAVQQIEDSTVKMDLPYEIPATIISVKGDGPTIISNYLGPDTKIPFISQKDYDNGGKLLFVNVNPIIQAMQISSNQSAFYPLLGELLDDINLTRMTPTTPLSDINGYVREINLKDNVSLQTSSILFPLELEPGEIAVTSGNSSRTFYNVNSIELSDFSPITIETDNATIKNGTGFYTEVQLNSTFSIKSPTNSLYLNIEVGNETITFDNVNSISINPDSNVHLQVRTPTITSSNVSFIELHLNNYPQLATQISGLNLNVTGLTKFSVMISDYYQAIGSLTLGPSLQSDLQTTKYDFVSTLPTAIFWALLLTPVFISVFIIFTLKKPSPENKRAIEKRKRPPES